MTIKICPNCNQRYSVQPHSGDYVHDCRVSPSDTTKYEDVVVMGSWEDYTGSGTVHNANLQGLGNRFQGTRAEIDGEDFDGVTKRGNRSSTHRERFHEQWIP